MFHGGRHGLVHAVGIGTFDEVGRPAVPAQEVLQLFVADARQQRGIVNLVAVQVQDGQHRPVANWAQEFADVPGSGQWPGLGFSVAHYCGDDQVRIIKCCAAGMRKYVAQFAAFVNRTRSFRRAVAADPPGK